MYDFNYFYFPLHHISSHDFFNYYPLLGFVEAMVYETDQQIESGQSNEKEYTADAPITRMKHIVVELLHELDLYDPLIEKELEQGEAYYHLENTMMHDKVITHENIIQAVERRTFDMRVLHRIFFRLLHKPYDEGLLSLIFPVEVIADIEDDLEQYQDDVKDNSFNTYRVFVKLYGKDAPKKLEAELKRYEDMMMQGLAKLPWLQRFRYLRMLAKFRKDHPEPAIPEPIIE